MTKKKIIIAAGSLLVLLCGVLVYDKLHKKIARTQTNSTRPEPVGGNTGNIGNIPFSRHEKPLFYLGDKKGQREGMYSADWAEKVGSEYVLSEPRMQLYPKGGQTVSISARKGTVETDELGQTVRARRGTLSEGVLIEVDTNRLPESQKPPRQQRAGEFIVIEVDNLEFDSDLLTLTSRGAVKVRSGQADIDAFDLRLAWNDNPRQLRYLRLARGQSMRIYEGLDKLNMSMEADQPVTTESAGAAAGKPPVAPSPTLAGQSTETTQTSDTTKANKPPEFFRLAIRDNVEVNGPKLKIANADLMELVFDMVEPDSQAQSTSKDSPAGGKPSDSPSPNTPASPATVTASTPAKAEPVVITWTGPLVLTPDEAASASLQTGQFELGLSGQNLMMEDAASSVRCNSFAYHGGRKEATIDGGAGGTVELRGEQGEQVACKRIVMNRQDQKARLDGPGWMHMTPESLAAAAASGTPQADASAPNTQLAKQAVHISWTDVVAIQYGRSPPAAGAKQAKQFIQLADITGDAHFIQDPTTAGGDDGGEMAADRMVIAFKPPAGPKDKTGQVSRVSADGRVKLQTGGTEDYMQADHLVADMANSSSGKMYPAHAVAAGSVKARQEYSEIAADRFEITFVETTAQEQADGAKAVRPEHIVAGGNVLITDVRPEEGFRVQAQTVDIVDAGRGGQDASATARRTAVFTGLPAKLQSKGSSIEGAVIRFNEAAETAEVPGPGKLTLQPAPEEGTTPAGPLSITWDQSMSLRDDVITFNGPVKLDGEEDHFLCEERLTIALEPAEQTATAAADAKDSLQGLGEGMSQRKIKSIKADKAVRVWSEKLTADGKIEQFVRITGDQLIYDAQAGQIDVVGQGTLLVTDYRPPPDTSGAAAEPKENLPRPSQTVFEFGRGMQFHREPTVRPDTEVPQVKFLGGMHMAHRSGNKLLAVDDPRVPKVPGLKVGRDTQLWCGELTARFSPPDPAAAATQGSEAKAKLLDGFRVGPLSEFRAMENVRMEDGPWVATAQRLTYSRESDVVALYGNPEGQTGQVARLEQQDASRGTYRPVSSEMFTWDRKTNRIDIPKAAGGR